MIAAATSKSVADAERARNPRYDAEATKNAKELKKSQVANADPIEQFDNNGRGPKNEGLNAEADQDRQVNGMLSASG